MYYSGTCIIQGIALQAVSILSHVQVLTELYWIFWKDTEALKPEQAKAEEGVLKAASSDKAAFHRETVICQKSAALWKTLGGTVLCCGAPGVLTSFCFMPIRGWVSSLAPPNHPS